MKFIANAWAWEIFDLFPVKFIFSPTYACRSKTWRWNVRLSNSFGLAQVKYKFMAPLAQLTHVNKQGISSFASTCNPLTLSRVS